MTGSVREPEMTADDVLGFSDLTASASRSRASTCGSD